MSILERSLASDIYNRPDFNEQRDLEDQLNAVIDRGIKLYLMHLAGEKLLSGDLSGESEFGAGIQAGLMRQLGALDSTFLPKKLETLASLKKFF